MLIAGFQKTSFVDYPGQPCAVVFTPYCNMDCVYCHNAHIIKRDAPLIPEEPVLEYLEKRAGLLTAVVISGGEPTLQPELPEFLEKIRNLGYAIKLDTNGTNPGMLQGLLRDGILAYVAMDIKNAPELYAETVGVPVLDLAPVERSKNYLLEGHVDYEFRTTVVRGLHTAESIAGAAKWIAGAKEYYLQQFKDSGDVLKLDGLGAYGEKEMHTLASSAAEYVPAVQVRGI